MNECVNHESVSGFFCTREIKILARFQVIGLWKNWPCHCDEVFTKNLIFYLFYFFQITASIILSATILISQNNALDEENYSSCSLFGMRDITKDICEQVARRKVRSLPELIQDTNKFDRFRVIYVKGRC